jgi:hypothetical protein
MATQTTPAPRSPKRSAAKSAATKSAKTTRPRTSTVVTPVIDPERRRAMIAEVAYIRAERRNFAPGYEVDDWLSAESEVDTLLTVGIPPSDN